MAHQEHKERKGHTLCEPESLAPILGKPWLYPYCAMMISWICSRLNEEFPRFHARPIIAEYSGAYISLALYDLDDEADLARVESYVNSLVTGSTLTELNEFASTSQEDWEMRAREMFSDYATLKRKSGERGDAEQLPS